MRKFSAGGPQYCLSQPILASKPPAAVPRTIEMEIDDAVAAAEVGLERLAGLHAPLERERRRLSLAELKTSFSCEFKGFERPERFVLATEDFTTDNNMLTPSLKVKRRNVMAKYGDAMARLYA